MRTEKNVQKANYLIVSRTQSSILYSIFCWMFFFHMQDAWHAHISLSYISQSCGKTKQKKKPARNIDRNEEGIFVRDQIRTSHSLHSSHRKWDFHSTIPTIKMWAFLFSVLLLQIQHFASSFAAFKELMWGTLVFNLNLLVQMRINFAEKHWLSMNTDRSVQKPKFVHKIWQTHAEIRQIIFVLFLSWM